MSLYAFSLPSNVKNAPRRSLRRQPKAVVKATSCEFTPTLNAGLEGRTGGGKLFTREEIVRARQANLPVYLESRGYTLKREGGQYRVVGFGGLIIEGNHWYHFSSGRGGNAIDLLVKFFGMGFHEAVQELLSRGPVNFPPKPLPDHQPHVEPEFRPPERASDNRRVAIYLTRVRKLPPTLVGWLIHKNLLYQDQKGNCVFPSYSRLGQPKGAFLRGTFSNFKGLATGSDSRYAWHWPPETESSVSVVCESPIDALSLVSLRPFLRNHHLVSLNGCRWEALNTFLQEWPEVRVVLLALDNDLVGRTAAEEFKTRLKHMGYTAVLLLPPTGFKDWNELLVKGQQTH